MINHSPRLGLVVLSIALLLIGVVLIFVSVLLRDSIGNFASLFLNAVAILIALAVPAMWRRRRNQQLR